MSRRILGAVLASTLLLALSAPAALAGEHSRDPVGCAASLSCTAEEINQMSMTDRLDFLRAMSAGPAEEILPGYQPRWRNIEGVITFFHDNELGKPGSWISYVDAGILEGIQRGIAIASGKGNDDFGNPGSPLWAEYLRALAAGDLAGRAAHDEAWSVAEQAATEHGAYLAVDVHGVEPSRAEQRFYYFSELYRWMMRNRPDAVDILSPSVEPGERRAWQHFVDWFTDVTIDTPAYRGSEMAYGYATFDVSGGTSGLLVLFRAYLEEQWDRQPNVQSGAIGRTEDAPLLPALGTSATLIP
ncbi:hypothetical protein [Haloechinothrix sp. LS1_15]|uniref:hypothetical protein n=1 Tax=Haloechinothrix sp. LS1_15 TaxID=2652248 RepID=UPI0029481304|nr:hypothetical protein [Haloechinothrix sp. LS1_15]MDV6012526.1 hypothetical protein [Haloechinothrix sp. LS1_15]